MWHAPGVPEAASPRRIFLSHTSELRTFPRGGSFVDSAEAAVIEAGHSVVDMAYFTVRDEQPASACEYEVSQCDAVVLIVGFRYGSPVRDRPGQSYVEWEWEVATRLGRPRFVFLLDDDAEGPSALFRDVHLGARQEVFRARLGGAGGVHGRVVTPGDLRLGVYKALVNHFGLTRPPAVERPGASGARSDHQGPGRATEVVRAVSEQLRTIAPTVADRALAILGADGADAALAVLRAEVEAMVNRRGGLDPDDGDALEPFQRFTAWADAERGAALAEIDELARRMENALLGLVPEIRDATASELRGRIARLDPRVPNKRLMRPSAVKELYQDVADQAVAVAVELLAEQFVQAVGGALRDDLGQMWTCVSGFRGRLSDRLADETLRPSAAPAIGWGEHFRDAFAETPMTAVVDPPDLDVFEKELDQLQRMILMNVLKVLPGGLLVAAIAAFAVMMRNDLRVAVSPAVRLAVIKRRVGDALVSALVDGAAVGQALTRAVELADADRCARVRGAREHVAELADQLADPSFAARYEERIYVVESVLDRCAALLATVGPPG